MRALYLTGFAIIGLTGCSGGGMTDVDPNGPVVTAADFTLVEGGGWSGNLTYLDYGSEKRVTIPATASVDVISSTTLKYSISYPKEPWEDTKAKIKLSQSGRVLDGHVVMSRETRPDGSVALKTLHQGEDNNQPAEIRLTYVLSASKFVIEKDVRFEASAEFMNRNIYRFLR